MEDGHISTFATVFRINRPLSTRRSRNTAWRLEDGQHSGFPSEARSPYRCHPSVYGPGSSGPGGSGDPPPFEHGHCRVSFPAGQVAAPQTLPPHTYHLQRNQYHSTELLEYLLDEDHDEPFRVLGITAVDLYIPIFTFVFGEAQLDGKAAIISTFRPGGGADDVRPHNHLFGPPFQIEPARVGPYLQLAPLPAAGLLDGFFRQSGDIGPEGRGRCKYRRIMLVDYFNAVNNL